MVSYISAYVYAAKGEYDQAIEESEYLNNRI
jgi:hypothetical protein